MHADLILVQEKMVSAPLALILSRSFEQGGTCGVFLSVRSKLGVLGVLVLGVIVTEEKQS